MQNELPQISSSGVVCPMGKGGYQCQPRAREFGIRASLASFEKQTSLAEMALRVWSEAFCNARTRSHCISTRMPSARQCNSDQERGESWAWASQAALLFSRPCEMQLIDHVLDAEGVRTPAVLGATTDGAEMMRCRMTGPSLNSGSGTASLWILDRFCFSASNDWLKREARFGFLASRSAHIANFVRRLW